MELAAAVALVAALAGVNHHQLEPPLSPARLWLARTGPALDALSLDVARASSPAAGAADSSIRPSSALLGAALRLRRLGPPPGGPAAAAWTSAVTEVIAASSANGSNRRLLLNEAGLALIRLELAVRANG